MRVTNAMYYNNWLKNLERTSESMQRNEMMTSSGKKILHLDDDPTGLSQVISIKEQITKQEEYLRAIDDGMGWLNTTESVLASVSDVLAKAQELAMEGANGTVSENENKELAQHIDMMIEDVISMANSQYGGKYLFSGQQTKQKPFELIDKTQLVNDTDSLTLGAGLNYRGDDKSVLREINSGNTMEINYTGEEVFVKSNVIGSLAKLKEAFESGDNTEISEAIVPVKKAFEDVVSFRARLGYKINNLETAKEQHEMQQFNLESILGDLEGADIAESITNLKKQETAYQAALMIGSQMMQMSLLDFLR